MFLGESGPAANPGEKSDPIGLEGFDYDSLDPATRAIAQQCACEVKGLIKPQGQHVIHAGQRLLAVKARLGYGRFGKWLETEFGKTSRTAQKFMRVAETFKNEEIFKNEEYSYLTFSLSALCRLAEPSTPCEARREALNMASKGQSITHARAKAIIKKYKPTKCAQRNNSTVQLVSSEIMPPEFPGLSASQKSTSPQLTISVASEPAALTPNAPETGGVQGSSSAQATSYILKNVKPLCPGVSEPERTHTPEEDSSDHSQSQGTMQAAPFPAIEVVSIEVDEGILRRNPLKLLKISTEGLSLCFNSRAGDVVSWFQEQASAMADNLVG